LPPEPAEIHPFRNWIIPALATAAGVVAVYIVFVRRPLPPAAPGSTAVTGVAPPSSASQSLGGRPDQVQVPPLSESDAVVRTLVRALSNSPAVETWLATNGLIRNFVVVVSNVADGVNPAKHLTPLKRPSRPFQLVARDGRQYIDPRSYDRYTLIADAVASV